MLVGSYTIPPSSDYPYFTTAKRYWLPESDDCAQSDREAYTLIVLHSTSFHKEIWEPVLQILYTLISEKSHLRTGARNKTKTANIKETWAIECPNHGESAYLNLRAWKANARPQCEYLPFISLVCNLDNRFQQSFLSEICWSSTPISRHSAKSSWWPKNWLSAAKSGRHWAFSRCQHHVCILDLEMLNTNSPKAITTTDTADF